VKYQLDRMAISFSEMNSPSCRIGCLLDPRDGPNAFTEDPVVGI